MSPSVVSESVVGESMVGESVELDGVEGIVGMFILESEPVLE